METLLFSRVCSSEFCAKPRASLDLVTLAKTVWIIGHGLVRLASLHLGFWKAMTGLLMVIAALI